MARSRSAEPSLRWLALSALVPVFAVACATDDGPSDGSSGETWSESSGACETAVCERICSGTAQIGVCVEDRCDCRCDAAECSYYCSVYLERSGACQTDGTCACTGCPFGVCGDDGGKCRDGGGPVDDDTAAQGP